MKILFFFIVLFMGSSVFSQIDLNLDLTGKPEYRKLLPNRRAFQIYRKDTSKVFYMLSANYFSFQGVDDTLEFVITGDSTDYRIQLKNDISEFAINLENDVLSFVSGEQIIEFDLEISNSKINTVHTPVKKGILPEDDEMGMVISQNRLTRYAEVNLNDHSFNIAVLDKNKNGSVDTSDLLALSYDNFFLTTESSRSISLDKKTCIIIGDEFYELIWRGGYNFRLEEIQCKNKRAIKLSNYVSDVTFTDGTSLSALVRNNKYTIVNIWSVYCLPCIKSIDSLNELENVIGIHLDEEVNISSFDIKFSNFRVSKEQLNGFNINGYPYYLVLSKDMEVIARYRSFESIDKK